MSERVESKTGQTQEPASLALDFVQFAVDCGVLRFGEFKTKAGRLSPYFFNAGLFDDGAKLGRLAQFYAQRLISSGIEFDMIFGPAYKGISLGAAVSIELIQKAGATAHAIAIALDRQEMATEAQADGSVKDVAHSAVQYVRNTLGMSVCCIAQLSDLLAYLSAQTGNPMGQHLPKVQAYRDRYGV